MRRRINILGATTLLLGACAMAPARTLADEPARGQLIVSGDHHLPGASFMVTGYGLDSGDTMHVQLVNGTTSVDLGDAAVAADGTMSMPAVVPSTFPLGYAEVVGAGVGGNQVKTVVLIGERAEGPAAQPATDWTSDRLAGIGMMAIGLVIAAVFGAMYLRGRRSSGSTPS